MLLGLLLGLWLWLWLWLGLLLWLWLLWLHGLACLLCWSVVSSFGGLWCGLCSFGGLDGCSDGVGAEFVGYWNIAWFFADGHVIEYELSGSSFSGFEPEHELVAFEDRDGESLWFHFVIDLDGFDESLVGEDVQVVVVIYLLSEVDEFVHVVPVFGFVSDGEGARLVLAVWVESDDGGLSSVLVV